MTLKMKLVCFLGATVLLLFAGDANAALVVAWSCYVPNSRIDCAVIKSSLTSRIPFLKMTNDVDQADVALTLRTVSADGGTRFKIDVVGRALDGYRTEVHTTEKVPGNVDAAATMVRVLTKLERALDDFMAQKETAEFENGTLTIRVSDPAEQPYAGRREQSAILWYLAPSLSGQMSNVRGVGLNVSSGASLDFNYSAPRWRLQQGAGASFRQISQPVPGTEESASVQFMGGSATNVFSRSLTENNRFTLGLLLSAEKNPQANYRMRGNASLGVEFNLVPRQTAKQKNLGFHCAIGPEYHHYDARNIQDLERQTVVRSFCDAFVSWHFQPVDVSANLGGNAILGTFDYRSITLDLSATWRVSDNVTIAPWFTIQQVHKAINEAQPISNPYSNPRQEIEASMRAAVQRGFTSPLSIRSGVSIRYVFGNGSLNAEDQRWKYATNLR